MWSMSHTVALESMGNKLLIIERINRYGKQLKFDTSILLFQQFMFLKDIEDINSSI